MRSLFFGPYTRRAARRATTIALVFQWIIVVTGATVRLTGSGLGCPNWPTCTTTRAVPALELHPLIEWTNRMTTTPTLLTALAAAWICWRISPGPRRDLRISTSLVVLGVCIQALLGALVVLLELPPEMVAAHFLVSIGLITAAVVAWHAARHEYAVTWVRGRGQWQVLAAVAMLVVLLGVIVAGVLTTASGPHSGASGTGQHVDRFGIFSLAVTVHARGAYLFLALVLALTWVRAQRGVALRDLGMLTALVVLQIALGEVQYRTQLPWQVVLAHVANASLLWLVAVRIAADATLAPPVSQGTATSR